VSLPDNICAGQFCLNCEDTVRLEDTGEEFGNAIYRKYRCPECGSLFKIEQVYRITERDVTEKDAENDIR